MATIASLKTQLDTVRTAIDDAVKTGRSYQIVSGHSVVNMSLNELRGEEQRLIKRIVRKAGYRSITL